MSQRKLLTKILLESWEVKNRSLLEKEWKAPSLPIQSANGSSLTKKNKSSSQGPHQKHLENEISDVADELAGAFNSLHQRRKITFPQRNTLQILSINSAFHPVSPLKSLSLERPRLIKKKPPEEFKHNPETNSPSPPLKKGVGEPRR